MSTALDSLQVRDSGPRPAALDCGFCGYMHQTANCGDSWQVVFEDEAFVAVPSVGSLVPGWLLVVPRTHYVNLASMGPSRIAQMYEFIDGFSEPWAAEFGGLVMFEHGPATEGRPAGCGVDHAHLHVVPCGDIDLIAVARRRLAEFDWTPVEGLSALAPAVAAGMDYLYVNSGADEVAAIAPDIPSQALRKVLAAELGSPKTFNWREHPRADVLRVTLERSMSL